MHGGGIIGFIFMKKFDIHFEEIISIDNLLCAWTEFLRGKKGKKDVCDFSLHFIDNILELHNDLANKTYVHCPYHAFKVNDPKPRDIHKATVRDRMLHHAIYRKLYPLFDKVFISDSFSCRNDKGTHKAIDRFRSFARKASNNNTKTCWVLKCDTRKFFASIDHGILLGILRKHILDENIIWLLNQVINSFSSSTIAPPQSEQYYSRSEKESFSPDGDICRRGLPLGNLTSQLFANIYLNELDKFLKYKLKIKYYIRYADDFVVLSQNRMCLDNLVPMINDFLKKTQGAISSK